MNIYEGHLLGKAKKNKKNLPYQMEKCNQTGRNTSTVLHEVKKSICQLLFVMKAKTFKVSAQQDPAGIKDH